MDQAINDAITKTVTAIEHIAPKAWALAVQAQRVDGYEDLGRGALLCVGAFAAIRVGRVIDTKMDELDKGIAIGISYVVAGIALFIAALAFPSAIAHILSPESFAFSALKG